MLGSWGGPSQSLQFLWPTPLRGHVSETLLRRAIGAEPRIKVGRGFLLWQDGRQQPCVSRSACSVIPGRGLPLGLLCLGMSVWVRGLGGAQLGSPEALPPPLSQALPRPVESACCPLTPALSTELARGQLHGPVSPWCLVSLPPCCRTTRTCEQFLARCPHAYFA